MSTATYSPEDNKLRLYVGRVPRDEYLALRAAGWTATPKQECNFVATWTPSREDTALSYLEEGEDIGDEDYSPEERAADKAERLEGYRDNRLAGAGAAADTFESGPAAFGHQNRARAERQARRHDRNRGRAVSQWSKAEYWQMRTAGVIRHALHKSSAHVRRGRILTLEAEQRKHEKEREEYATRYNAWKKVTTLEGADKAIVMEGEEMYATPAVKLAYALANSSGCYGEYQHPRKDRKSSLYSLMTDATDPITAAEAAAFWLEGCREPSDPESRAARWSAHYELRLTYERAMIAEEGGNVGETDIEPGGWIRPSRRDVTFGHAVTNTDGFCQILRVFKSPATGRVTSVQVMGGDPYLNDPKIRPRTINVERLGENAYRAPTDEERQQFAAVTKTRKAEAKASKPAAPALINPTDKDAALLQGIWNDREQLKHAEAKKAHRVFNDFVPAQVERLTQAQYSQLSKGTYTTTETRTLHADAKRSRRSSNMYTSEGSKYDKEIGPALCKIRVRGYDPVKVVVITDKPQKPLPEACWEPKAPAVVEEKFALVG